MSLDLEGIIAKRKIRDWMHNEDVINKIQIDIDDYLYDIRNSGKVNLTTRDMDTIMERCISVARRLAGN